MSERVIVFRVSRWFLERINSYCKEEGITYAELFERAIKLLCKKYLEVEDAETEDCGGEDRDGSEAKAISEIMQNSPNVRAD